MARVLVAAWGANSKAYIGKSLTLFRDASVKWAGMEVGGIRISHMSDIGGTQTIPITVTRGNKKPYLVKPLAATTATATAITQEEIATLKEEAVESADAGTDTLKAFWTGLGAVKQKAIGGAEYLEELKTIANKKGTENETAN
jgi:hypothetical protein